MNISIVTVINNAMPFLDRYFYSISLQKFKGLEIILVDSDLLPDTKEKIKHFWRKYRNHFNIKYIPVPETIGFAKGNNIGVDKARARYIFLLNPDTKLETSCLQLLYNSAMNINNEHFILIARQKSYTTKKFLIDGVCVDIFGFPYKIFNAYYPHRTKRPFYCDGAAMFMPIHTFRKLGGFDEDLFTFTEDVDLSWRAHLLHIPFYNEPRAIVYHYGGGSIRGGIRMKKKIYRTSYFRRYLGERNAQRNLLKNYTSVTLLWVLPLYLCINVGEIAVFLITNKHKVAFQYVKAWWWNLINIHSTLEKRKWIQSRRIVGDRDIFKQLYFGSGKLNAFLHIRYPKFE